MDFQIDSEQVALLVIKILDLIPAGVLQEVPVPHVENIRISADRRGSRPEQQLVDDLFL